MKTKDCCISNCDLFDFMSNHVGLKILHPGGLKATRLLYEKLPVNRNTRVLDLACGKGVNSIMLAKKIGCKVTGVDISEDSVLMAKKLAVESKVEHLVNFELADAHKLPFKDNSFDITISQAMLILMDDKSKVVSEVCRVLKPEGISAWLELSWKDPSDSFVEIAKQELCGDCISNVQSFDGWQDFFQNNGVKLMQSDRYAMNSQNMISTIRDEGLKNGILIMYKYITNRCLRNRMQKLNRFFKNYNNHIGYGIFIGKN